MDENGWTFGHSFCWWWSVYFRSDRPAVCPLPVSRGTLPSAAFSPCTSIQNKNNITSAWMPLQNKTVSPPFLHLSQKVTLKNKITTSELIKSILTSSNSITLNFNYYFMLEKHIWAGAECERSVVNIEQCGG